MPASIPPASGTQQSVKHNKRRRELLDPSDVVVSESNRYIILDLLGSGGFGDVYKVCRQDDLDQIYALKTEEECVADRLRRLKVEAEVLTLCGSSNRPHFIALIDKGRTATFKFIVMPVVGPTLNKVRNNLIAKQFTKSTANKISVQLMESLRDLHELGYLHRDLKPANFAIGLHEAERETIFMLDFGVAKRYIDKNGQLLVPRRKVAFMGTPRFCSRTAHRLHEQSRKDDLESLLYVIADTFNETYLPWRGQRDRVLVLQLKDKFMTETEEFAKNVPPAFITVLRRIEALDYETKPAYEFYINTLATPIKTCTQPLDWLTDNYTGPKAEPKPTKKTAMATRIIEETIKAGQPPVSIKSGNPTVTTKVCSIKSQKKKSIKPSTPMQTVSKPESKPLRTIADVLAGHYEELMKKGKATGPSKLEKILGAETKLEPRDKLTQKKLNTQQHRQERKPFETKLEPTPEDKLEQSSDKNK